MEKALKIRKAIKKRKPTFRRVQGHQFAKLSEVKWRRPKGMGNKVRRQRRGKPKMPQVGYKSPKVVRGLNSEGLREILISNVRDLESINKGEIAVISRRVGSKKKLEILNLAKSKKINIGNVKNIDDEIKKLTKKKKEKKEKSKSLKESHKKANDIKEIKEEDKKDKEDKEKNEVESKVKKDNKKEVKN